MGAQTVKDINSAIFGIWGDLFAKINPPSNFEYFHFDEVEMLTKPLYSSLTRPEVLLLDHSIVLFLQETFYFYQL